VSQTYTRLFGRAAVTDGSSPLLFLADDLATYVVRDLVIYNGGGAEDTFYLFILSTGGSIFLFAALVPPFSTSHVDLRQVLAAGDQLYASSATQTYTAAVTGYVFIK
jgi:hypothetical protein